MRPKTLIITDYYLPGFKAGGPIRTLANIVEALGDEFTFHVITRDRDLGDSIPYPDVANGSVDVGKAHVSYVAPHNLTTTNIQRLLHSVPYDIIYLNSFFSPFFSIIPLLLLRFSKRSHIPVILAPRGEFALSALNIKAFKKRCYLLCAKLTGVCNSVVWQASGEHEAQDIRREFPNALIVLAPDLPPIFPVLPVGKNITKTPGQLRIVFLSRISRMKNLLTAIKILRTIHDGQIYFDIWGPIEDEAYWSECQQAMAELPDTIKATYCGVVLPDQVQATLARYDLLFLPTLGENFGHVILEALAAGTPALISDRTQWQNLSEYRAGWDIPLNEPQRFADVLHLALAMDAQAWRVWSHGARQYVATHCDLAQLKAKTAQLFSNCLRQSPGRSIQ
jgi:glycosyltransferase involved in cell wall biosynthesis